MFTQNNKRNTVYIYDEDLPVVDKKVINITVLSMGKSYLNIEQKYLHDIYTAMINVFCLEKSSHKNTGKSSQSQWLTTTSRILHVYIDTQNSFNEFQALTEFIIKVYAPVCFTI